MITADAAVINTAAAPTSFPTFARGWRWGLARSTTASKAVFKNSAVHTEEMVNSKTAQSRSDKPNQIAIDTTQIVAMAWIHAFFWVRMTYHHPENADRKE